MGQGRYHFDWNLVGPAGLYWRSRSDFDQKFSEYALQPVIFSCLAGQFGAKVHTGGILHVPIFTWDAECYKWLSLEASLMPTLANPSRSQFDRVTSAQVGSSPARTCPGRCVGQQDHYQTPGATPARQKNEFLNHDSTYCWWKASKGSGRHPSLFQEQYTHSCMYIYICI